MRRCLLAGLLVSASLAGCEEHGRSPATDAPVDQLPRVDAPHPRNDPGTGPFQQPFEASFVTPAGPFDAHELSAAAVGGDCNPPFWELRFSAADTGVDPTVTLQVSMPPYTGVEVSGTMPASAHFQPEQPGVGHTTQAVTFAAMRIDYPADGAPRITGHFSDTDPTWTIDLAIDVLGVSSGCI